jgi:hypothetical protein
MKAKNRFSYQLKIFVINFCFVASRKGNLKMVQILLKNGANIEKKDKDGCTPLIWDKSIY